MGLLMRSWAVVGLVVGGCGAGSGEEPAETRSRATVVDMEEYHYTVVPVPAPPPEYLGFQSLGLTSSRELVGSAFMCPASLPYCVDDLVKMDLAGHFTVLARDFYANFVGDRGDAAGCLARQDEQHTCDTAMVHADGRVELFLPEPGEYMTWIWQMSDGGTVLLSVYGETGLVCPVGDVPRTDYVVINGERRAVNIGSNYVDAINDRGDITGTYAGGGAYRYDAKTQTQHPLTSGSCDTAIQPLAINQAGLILGSVWPKPGPLFIGTWDETNTFSLVLTENTPEFPVLGHVTWNDRGLIVLSATSDDHTYLMPKGRELLDLASLVESGEVPPHLRVSDVNERGDLLGVHLDTETYAEVYTVLLRSEG